MAKLYPPYIEGSIPAFIGTQLAVPYEMNKTVGYKDISGFKLKIITVSTNRTIQIVDDSGYNIETKEAYFNMPIDKMVVGQFYKVQLAYKDLTGAIGFYSTIGVVKYSSTPKISIEGLQAGNINLHQYDYVGRYEPSTQDPTEVEIYYQFDVYDYNNQLYASSGKKIHNATIEGGDLFQLADTFEKQLVYSIKYTVWTLNGLKVFTRKYRLMERQSLDIEIEAELKVEQNYDEGYIKVSLLDTAEKEQVVEGAFLITRADSLSNYKIWNELYRFELRNKKLKSFSFKDFTIQQGVKYQYSIQQYNDNGLYSNRLLSEHIKADFEDSFLYDGERQLKIRFNPKMTSFKNTVLEQKVNTIGSKYPFIFKNGNVSYKEFPIGGLISYLSDAENLFTNDYDLNNYHRHDTPADDETLNYLPTDLVSENITKERLFKLKALEWLTNGEPKLFRSPTEGNYIVRLLNTNMAPENALGRMIHNFTATAYEIAELNYDNLVSYGFINSNKIDKTQLKWETVELAVANKDGIEYKYGQLNKYPAVTVEFTGMRPGDIILLDGQKIQIGVTGSYYASLDSPIKIVSIPDNANYIGFMTYSFYGESVSKFNKIFNIELNETPSWRIENTSGTWLDILDNIEDMKTELVSFYYLRFRKADHLNPKDNNEQNNIYPVLNNDLIPEKNEYLIRINDEYISIDEIEVYEIKDFDRPDILWIGPDIICEAGYQTKVIDYNIENDNKELIESKNNYQNALNNYLALLEEYPEEMKRLEDQLNYHLLMQKTNEEVEYLTKKEKAELENEINFIEENDYYKSLTFEEAQNYTNTNILSVITENKENFDVPRDPWNKIYDEILIEIELADREGNKELKEYWSERRDELYTIMSKYLPEDSKYKYSKNSFDIITDEITTSLHHRDGAFNYQPGDKVYKDGKIIAHPGIELSIAEKNWVEKGESYSLAQAYYLPTNEFNYNPSGDIMKDSLWIDAKDQSPIVIYPDEYYEVIDKDADCVRIDVDTYIGPSDPTTMEIYVDLWIDNSDITSSFEDSLQKEVDMFYYNGESYKDIAYLDPVVYLAAQEIFNEQYKIDMEKLKADKDTIEAEVNRASELIKGYEANVHNAKTAIAKLNQQKKELEDAVENAQYEYDKIVDSAVNKEEQLAALNKAKEDLEKFLSSEDYINAEVILKAAEKALKEAQDYLSNQQTLLNKANEKIKWLENSKDFLFNISEEYYVNDKINTGKDYHDGGWCSAVMRHRIYSNEEYDDIYDEIEGIAENGLYPPNTINYYRNLAYNISYSITEIDSEGNPSEFIINPANFLTEEDKNKIENYYYTNQELALEERVLVEDIIMEAITKSGYDKEFTYRDKQEFDKCQNEILKLKIERDKALKDIPISIMDFTEPERYFLLFSRSHYVENEDTKRPVIVDNDGKVVAGKGYCMYQFYDKTTAEKRVKQLEINIDGYIKKHNIKEAEVEDWIIRNDINERDELLAYLKYLDINYPTNQLSAPGYNIFRPITLNEIIDGKLYIEEELELAYKQYKESNKEAAKRLEIGLSIPDFYYKTGNYTRLKECQDRIIELDKILEDIFEWRENNPEDQIEDLLKQIKSYGDSLNTSKNYLDTQYKNYITKLEKILKEEELK